MSFVSWLSKISFFQTYHLFYYGVPYIYIIYSTPYLSSTFFSQYHFMKIGIK